MFEKLDKKMIKDFFDVFVSVLRSTTTVLRERSTVIEQRVQPKLITRHIRVHATFLRKKKIH